MTFCGSCGTQLTEGVRFCTSCGSPVGSATPRPFASPDYLGAPPAVQMPTPAQAPPAVRRRRPSWQVFAAAAAVVAVAVCGGVAFALTRGGGGETIGYDGVASPLAKAITSEPKEVWDWPVPGTDEYGPGYVVAAGDDALVGYSSGGSAHVTALDSEGNELWEIEADHADWLRGVIPESDVFVLGPYEEGVGIEARSTENGDFAWWFEDGNVAALTEAGVLFSEHGALDDDVDYTFDMGLLDSETGKEIWRSQTDSWAGPGRRRLPCGRGGAAQP